MKITAWAKTNSKSEKVEKTGDGRYKVFVNRTPKDGEANARIIELLSEHFEIPKSLINLVQGAKSKKKIFMIQSK